jgi:hypothetical protein
MMRVLLVVLCVLAELHVGKLPPALDHVSRYPADSWPTITDLFRQLFEVEEKWFFFLCVFLLNPLVARDRRSPRWRWSLTRKSPLSRNVLVVFY